jgi:hypothetical protein
MRVAHLVRRADHEPSRLGEWWIPERIPVRCVCRHTQPIGVRGGAFGTGVRQHCRSVLTAQARCRMDRLRIVIHAGLD